MTQELEQDGYVHPGQRIAKSGAVLGHGQGMTMRDYFAGQALPRAQMTHAADRRGRTVGDIAYGIADQMMKAREGRDLDDLRELNELKAAAHAVNPMDDRIAWTRYHNKLQSMYESGAIS